MVVVLSTHVAHVRRLRVGLLVLLLFLTPLASIAFGAAAVPVRDVVDVLASHLGLRDAGDPVLDAIIWTNRMPRILAGIGTGAVLAVAGVGLQAIVRNPLAEPYVLGVSSGASTGAAAGIILLGLQSTPAVASLACVGALVATALVMAVGGRSGGTTLTLVLAGLAVGFIFQALTNLVIFSSDSPEAARSVMFWMLGSLSKVDWTQSCWILLVALVTVALLWWCAPWLDALAGGDRSALAVGIDPVRTRCLLLVPLSSAVAVVVALIGGIGFVGLIIPHLMRAWTGHGHRGLIISAALGGAIFLVGADTLSRTLFSPSELPVGVVTGLLGAPFLLLMVGRLGTAR